MKQAREELANARTNKEIIQEAFDTAFVRGSWGAVYLFREFYFFSSDADCSDTSGRSAADLLVIPSPGKAIEQACKYRKPKGGDRHYRMKYDFRDNWFTQNVPVWAKALAPFKGKPNVNYLEIGVYEGGSFLWMLENILTDPTARATGIDIFPENLKERFVSNVEKPGSDA